MKQSIWAILRISAALILSACGSGSTPPVSPMDNSGVVGVVGTPVIFPLPPQGATVNQPYTFTFQVQPDNLATFSATGPLPPGLNPVTSGGVLAGTPTATGTFPIVVRALNSLGSGTQNFTVQVLEHGFRRSGTMIHPVAFHTATLLTTGQVLIAGGLDEWPVSQTPAAWAELFDPVTQTFTATASMQVARASHTATLLCDPSVITCSNPLVLISGGQTGEPSNPIVTQTAELFDPVKGAFTSTGSLLAPRAWHTATLLGSGKVLIAGGVNLVAVGPTPSLAASGELYDPITGTFATTGNLNTPRLSHTATLLKNGKVLIAGGVGGNNGVAPVAVAELYDPATGLFTPTGVLLYPRSSHSAMLLTNGKVLIAGGVPTATAEIYDPDTETFTATGAMVTPPQFFGPAAAVSFPNGTVLIVGGGQYAELYDPATGTFSEAGGLQMYGSGAFAMTPIGANSPAMALVTGDADDGSAVAEVYQ